MHSYVSQTAGENYYSEAVCNADVCQEVIVFLWCIHVQMCGPEEESQSILYEVMSLYVKHFLRLTYFSCDTAVPDKKASK